MDTRYRYLTDQAIAIANRLAVDTAIELSGYLRLAREAVTAGDTETASDWLDLASDIIAENN